MRAAVEAGLIEPTVLTGPTISTQVRNDNRGNQFISYSRQVGEAWKRWKNIAQYGNEIVRLVVKFRAGMVAGNGANMSADRAPERKFLDDFLEANRFDGSLLQRIVVGTEIEGRALLYLRRGKIQTPEGDRPTVAVRYLPWEKWKYEVILDDMDDTIVRAIEFEDSSGRTVRIPEDEFVYIVVDESNDMRQPNSPIASVLTYAVNMGKAMADWRAMNHLWGALGAYFEAPDTSTAQMMINVLAQMEARSGGGWQYGDTLAGPAKMYFPEPSGRGQDSIGNEIDAMARIISGSTGVPIHAMGWAREMSNRATAEELTDSVVAHTAPNREAIEEGLKGMIRKATRLYARWYGDPLRWDRISVSLAQVTRQQVADLVNVWLPLAEGGYISDEDVRERIPGIDAREVKQRLKKQKDENVLNQTALMETMRGMGDDDEPEVGAA